MKKTLIALMALGGLACGTTLTQDQANAWFDTYLDGIYTTGDSFTLTFTIATEEDEGTNANAILTMANDFHIVKQHPDYVALSGRSDGGKTASNADISWVDPDPSSSTNGVNTFNVSGKAYQWISYGADGSTHLGASENATNPNRFVLAEGSITLTYVAGGVSTLEIYSKQSAVTERIVFASNTLILNAADIAFGDCIGSISNATFTTGGKTYSIPEPATATLSQLALCGLCARRRRA